MNKRKIAVVTATRAEYDLLTTLLTEIRADDALELQLVVTGSHLSPEFGLTIQQIIADGYPIAKSIEMLLSSDTPVGISKSMGLAQIGFAEAYAELKPDIVVVLGDRYELIPIVSAAVVSFIPVAHLNGGELTEGSMDELFRHAITKLSKLHFTALEDYARRIIRMGEDPSRVFNVGMPGLDRIQTMETLSRGALEKSLGLSFKRHNYLVTYHPETCVAPIDIENQFKIILAVLDEQQDSLFIFTKSNADAGGRVINRMIDDYVGAHPEKSIAFISLGQARYCSLLRIVDAVVGNSSSGIIEAPSFHIGTINIGTRQQGRVRGESVIDAALTLSSIRDSFNRLKSDAFQQRLPHIENRYGRGDSAVRVKNILRDFDLSLLRMKVFYDD